MTKLATVLPLTLAALLAAAPPTLAGDEALRIYTREPGVYRVLYEDLAAAGLDADDVASDSLSLANLGEPVPLWVVDGGDGRFGPGDAFEFVAEILHGAGAYYHEYSRFNVYRLGFDSTAARRMAATSQAPATEGGLRLRRRQHLEEDTLMVRLSGVRADAAPPETWYWAKLTHIRRQPWTTALDLSDLDAASGDKVDLRIHFRALSDVRGKKSEAPDHRVEVSVGGALVAAAEWDGKTEFLLEAIGLDPSLFAGGAPELALHVPKRLAGEKGSNSIVDVVMLNWIEIDYPRTAVVGEDPVHLRLAAGSGDAVRLSSAAASLVAYGDLGSRTELAAETERPGGAGRVFRLRPAPGESSLHVVPDDRLRRPAAIEVDRPSDLKGTANRADYLMIAHRDLVEPVRPLAEFHRRRGLEVALVDAQDVYDEFNHGILDPVAIRDFIAYAHDRWQPPTARFVLLVGDASWDTKNTTVDDANYANWATRQFPHSERFGTQQSAVYGSRPDRNLRLLIPTWNHQTYQGHAASDNFFVAVAGDDNRPDLAIGRLPVLEPEEVTRIVEKTIRYASRPEVGPWRRNLLLITNESRGFQIRSDHLAGMAAERGLSSEKVYPASTEVSNEHHSARLVEAFNEGQLVVHFLGHGGRFIWRTGPPDLKKNHDLFTLEHLDQLRPTGRLPVVLSLTCFSAPFDHPNADSIGEKLLRLPESGAIAVFAASWRNTPSARWGQVLLEELTRPGSTVGEAVMRAKHQIPNRDFVETYNLLGDPAVPVALPSGRVALAADLGDEGPLQVRGEVELGGFSGNLVIDVTGADGEPLRTLELRPETPAFALEVPLSDEEREAVRAVRAYAWDAVRGVDAAGAVALAGDPPAEAAAGPAGRRARGPASGR